MCKFIWYATQLKVSSTLSSYLSVKANSCKTLAVSGRETKMAIPITLAYNSVSTITTSDSPASHIETMI